MPDHFFTYVLQNPTQEIYIGQTNNLSRRIAQHNDPKFKGTLHTKRRKGLWILIHSEEFATRGEAMKRERELKTARGRKFLHNLGGSE